MSNQTFTTDTTEWYKLPRPLFSGTADSDGRGDGPPYIKLSRAVRYHRPSLDQWMLERQRNHTAEGEA